MNCLTDFCCTCFCKKQPLKHLSATDNENITYYVKLTSCVPEMCFKEMNDQRLVCNKCCEIMNTVYKFRQTCLTSKAKLIDYISQLPTVSDVSGAANVCLTNIKQEYQSENNIETNFEQVYLFTDVGKYHNEIENSEIRSEYNPVSCKLTDNAPINIKKENINMENEEQNSEKAINESLDSSPKNQRDIIIDIIENDIKLVVTKIKEENEDQDNEEHSSTSFDNILESGESENENMEYLGECYEASLTNQDEIKADTVDNDNENIRERPYQCSVCKRKFKQIYDLKFHMRIHTGDIPYECGVCKKKFRLSSILKNHMKIHTGEKSYECNVCEKKYKQPHNLKRHMNIHTAEKQYECSVCQEKFRLLNNLKNHMKIHTGEKPYECEICKKRFMKSQNYKCHMYIHIKEKPYECSQCKKKFKQPNDLKRHTKIHTGERKNECGVCKKKFKQTYDLKRHMNIHTGEKPYECSVCNKKFIQPHDLKRHMRIHKRENLVNV